ncbi:unnamed protein product [Cuscuta epithymum]|uniref:Agenet domain-containing protein n=2 Tax=Cuscuta epithymum TaxID=186058 RepID=A0AAV0D9I0_9ASTE|nr:unnamed protein product [Cuscuta epithymum]
MDYNGNDYQSKDLHVAGEDSSKVSPVLRPFTLPRFDFDDSLQGHLRFDSLVENEVFLGIPCQEDNQWIEDFPRESSGIVEFSSSVTEPCSITGHNNVWYEATSSESVEMLLKSVGQEHNLPEDTTIHQSNCGKELSDVTHNMEPSFLEDDKMDYVEDTMVDVQTDQYLDKFSRSSEITDGEKHHFKCTLSVAGTSFKIDANSESSPLLDKECSLVTPEKCKEILPSSEPSQGINSHIIVSSEVNECKHQLEEPSLLQDDKMHYVKGPVIGVQSDQFLDKFPSPSEITEGEIGHCKCETPVLGTSLKIEANTESSDLLEKECNMLTLEDCKDNSLSHENSQEKNSHIFVCSGLKESKHQHEEPSSLEDDKIHSLEDPVICVQTDQCLDKFSRSSEIIEEQMDHFKYTSSVERSSLKIDANTESSALLEMERDLLTPEECKESYHFSEPSLVNNSQISVSSEVNESKHQLEETSLLDDDKMDNADDPMVGVQTNQLVDKFSRSSEITEGEFDHSNCTSPQVAGTSVKFVSNVESQLTPEEQIDHFKYTSSVERSSVKIDANTESSALLEMERDLLTPEECKESSHLSEPSLLNNSQVSVSSEVNESKHQLEEASLLDDDKMDYADDPLVGVQTNQFVDKFSRSSEITEGELDHSNCTSPQVVGTSVKFVANLESQLTPEECKENSLSAEPSQVNNSHTIVSSEGKERKNQLEGDNIQQDDKSVSFKSFCATDVREADDQDANLEREEVSSSKITHEQNNVNEQEHNTIDNSSLSSELVTGSNLFHADDHVSPRDVCLPAEIQEVTHVGEKFEGGEDALRSYHSFEVDYCDRDHVSSHATYDDPEKICREDSSSKQPINAVNRDLDVSFNEKEETVSTTVSSDMENNKSIGHLIETVSSLGVECLAHVENVHGTEFAKKKVNKALCTEEEDATHSSHDIGDNVSFTEISDVPAAVVNQSEKLPLPVKDEMDTICPAEKANLSASGSSFQMEIQPGPVCGVEKGVYVPTLLKVHSMDGDIGHQHESVYPGTPMTADHSIPVIEAAGTETKTDQARVSGEVRHHSSMVEEIVHRHHLAAELEGHDANGTAGKHVETESVEKSESEVSKEQHAPNVSSVVTTSTLIQNTEREKREVDNKGAAESVSCPLDIDDFRGKVESMCVKSSAYSLKKEMGKDSQLYGSSKIPEVMMEVLQPIDKTTPSSGAKGGSEHKIRRRSCKPGREISKKGNQVKETPVILSERVDKSRVHLGSSVSGQSVQVEAGSVQRSGTKISNVDSISTSILPDLNSSTTPVPFQQPFTDLQQVQLRAQIFVYGSLIQGAAPDEAIMVSAFGTTSGGRNVWEPAWRACVEKLHAQKSLFSSSEVAHEPGSGLKTPDQTSKYELHKSKALSSNAPRPSSSRGTSIPPIISPMIPLSTPIWSIATPSCTGLPPTGMAKGTIMGYQAVSPLPSFQTPPMRNFLGHTNSSLSQTSLTAPWVASSPQTSGFDISTTRIPVFPIADPVNLTIPTKESSGVCSGTKYASPISVSPPCMPPSGVLPQTSAQHSTELKSKKRKKASRTEAPGQIPLSILPGPAARVSCRWPKLTHSSEDIGQASLIPESETVTAFCTPIASNLSSMPIAVSPSISANHSKIEDTDVEKRKLTLLDFNRVDDARLQSVEAAEHAAVALGHCQDIWSELEKQKNSGLMSDVETKLASVAATIAAAASVAKAAAAAAKIASNVASQARQMADEVLASNESRTDSLPDFVRNIEGATPASILKGGWGGPNVSGSVIIAAREAAKRRIDLASANSIHAENLDAIVKAAELAAEAVSHAGKVVAMGDPSTLSELIEAGPDGYWKVSKTLGEQCVKSNGATLGKTGLNATEMDSDVCVEKSEWPSRKALKALTMDRLPLQLEGGVRVEEEISTTIVCAENEICGSKSPAPEPTKSPDSSSTKPEVDSRLTSLQEAYGKVESSTSGENIKEGCLVEVFRDSGDLNDAWFLANVLNLKDGNAFVSYTELQSEKGHLKEWIPLYIDGDEVPRIRVAKPMTVVHFEGARKRKLAEVKDYSWSVGDQVDAWIHVCWREGIIVEKNKKDETMFTVNFPARGDNAVVRAQHLRPRLIWKDGLWIEWFTSREQTSPKSNTRKGKRAKLRNATNEEVDWEKVKVTKSVDVPELETTKEETKSIHLSAAEKSFNIGAHRNENNQPKPATHRTMRSGLLQKKEGPKVIFGVPKPGKKRKFMDVSKHYDSNRGGVKSTTASSTNDSAKIVIPTRSGVGGGWRNSTKTDDAKEKKFLAESKPKPPLKPRKPLTSSKISKDNYFRSTPTSSADVSHDKSESGYSDSVKFGPNAEEVAESKALPPAVKKAPKLKNRPEQMNRGNFATGSGMLTKQEEVNDKSTSETNEPRRSNRRIQPTSRLLEGLESSLVIPKLPSVSHDKTHKNHNRGATSKG